RFSGLVADISLVLNLALILGSMAICNATFTLPGLAGMVLTIGMAVDTNVLIYERMREEMARGSSLRMTIFNGFDKALSAIVDSNITTLIAAVVLYMIGTDQIKGFAVTLFIGITMSMFSALYFGHLMFDVVERKRWIKELKMGKLIGVTLFDFISPMKAAVIFSVSFILLGVALLFYRGNESLDIDFSGGSMVTFQFQKPQQIDDVRTRLSETFSNSMSLERLALPDESQAAESGKQFRLRTKEQDINKIRDGISTTFADDKYKLHHVTVEFTAPTTATATQDVSRSADGLNATGIALDHSSGPPPAAKGNDELKAEANKDDAKKADRPKAEPAGSDKPAADKPADDKKSEAKTDDKPPSETNDTEAKKDTENKETGKKEEAAPAAKPDDDKQATPKVRRPDETFKPARKKTPAKAPVESAAPEPSTATNDFAGGQRSELTFSSESKKATEITTATAGDYLLTELKKINKSYSDPDALFRITGLEGSGLEAKEGRVRTYSKMLLETRPIVAPADLAQALAAMRLTMSTTPIFEEVSNFASSVAEDMRYLAILALLASGVATVIYLWFRFTKADFGVAAVIAVFHDVLFVLATLPMA
ncbi:MAG TPA: MMPL family transporter, partial [Planctomycetaceae bacterium]|nr:MMPL family transporter [Planctomycetaceae bacterium]